MTATAPRDRYCSRTTRGVTCTRWTRRLCWTRPPAVYRRRRWSGMWAPNRCGWWWSGRMAWTTCISGTSVAVSRRCTRGASTSRWPNGVPCCVAGCPTAGGRHTRRPATRASCGCSRRTSRTLWPAASDAWAPAPGSRPSLAEEGRNERRPGHRHRKPSCRVPRYYMLGFLSYIFIHHLLCRAVECEIHLNISVVLMNIMNSTTVCRTFHTIISHNIACYIVSRRIDTYEVSVLSIYIFFLSVFISKTNLLRNTVHTVS